MNAVKSTFYSLYFNEFAIYRWTVAWTLYLPVQLGVQAFSRYSLHIIFTNVVISMILVPCPKCPIYINLL